MEQTASFTTYRRHFVFLTAPSRQVNDDFSTAKYFVLVPDTIIEQTSSPLGFSSFSFQPEETFDSFDLESRKGECGSVRLLEIKVPKY